MAKNLVTPLTPNPSEIVAPEAPATSVAAPPGGDPKAEVSPTATAIRHASRRPGTGQFMPSSVARRHPATHRY